MKRATGLKALPRPLFATTLSFALPLFTAAGATAAESITRPASIELAQAMSGENKQLTPEEIERLKKQQQQRGRGQNAQPPQGMQGMQGMEPRGERRGRGQEGPRQQGMEPRGGGEERGERRGRGRDDGPPPGMERRRGGEDRDERRGRGRDDGPPPDSRDPRRSEPPPQKPPAQPETQRPQPSQRPAAPAPAQQEAPPATRERVTPPAGAPPKPGPQTGPGGAPPSQATTPTPDSGAPQDPRRQRGPNATAPEKVAPAPAPDATPKTAPQSGMGGTAPQAAPTKVAPQASPAPGAPGAPGAAPAAPSGPAPQVVSPIDGQKRAIGERIQNQDAARNRWRQERQANQPGQAAINLDQLKQQRQEKRVEGGKLVIEEPDQRRIIRSGDRAFIIRDENRRFRQFSKDMDMRRRPGGGNIATIARPDGSRIISETAPDGRLIRRYRRDHLGHEHILIDNRRTWRRWGAFAAGAAVATGVMLAINPPRYREPRHYYIVDYERASYDDVYDALMAPPIDVLDRGYSLDEVIGTYNLRERMRRVDLDSINFETGSWEVSEAQYDKLDRVARAMGRIIGRNPDEVFLIEGHTDAVGDAVDNLSLSDRRAESVANILTQEYDIPPENLITQGYGEQHLKIDTDGPERANRRVTVRRITPLLERRVSGRYRD